MTTNLKAAARGQWKQILPSLGVNAEVLVNKHGPCPICHGKDRFRFDDQHGDGGFICNQCGAGDGFALAQRVTGKSFHEIAKVMEDMLGLDQNYLKKRLKKLHVLTVWDGEIKHLKKVREQDKIKHVFILNLWLKNLKC